MCPVSTVRFEASQTHTRRGITLGYEPEITQTGRTLNVLWAFNRYSYSLLTQVYKVSVTPALVSMAYDVRVSSSKLRSLKHPKCFRSVFSYRSNAEDPPVLRLQVRPGSVRVRNEHKFAVRGGSNAIKRHRTLDRAHMYRCRGSIGPITKKYRFWGVRFPARLSPSTSPPVTLCCLWNGDSYASLFPW